MALATTTLFWRRVLIVGRNIGLTLGFDVVSTICRNFSKPDIIPMLGDRYQPLYNVINRRFFQILKTTRKFYISQLKKKLNSITDTGIVYSSKLYHTKHVAQIGTLNVLGSSMGTDEAIIDKKWCLSIKIIVFQLDISNYTLINSLHLEKQPCCKIKTRLQIRRYLLPMQWTKWPYGWTGTTFETISRSIEDDRHCVWYEIANYQQKYD